MHWGLAKLALPFGYVVIIYYAPTILKDSYLEQTYCKTQLLP